MSQREITVGQVQKLRRGSVKTIIMIFITVFDQSDRIYKKQNLLHSYKTNTGVSVLVYKASSHSS